MVKMKLLLTILLVPMLVTGAIVNPSFFVYSATPPPSSGLLGVGGEVIQGVGGEDIQPVN